MERELVIRTIRDLAAKTVARGCTEHEAIAAAEKVGELLKVYNLTIDKVFLGETKCRVHRVGTGRRRRSPIDSCIVTLASFCDCKIWLEPKRYRESEYCFLDWNPTLCWPNTSTG